jgi:hypothetical protein
VEIDGFGILAVMGLLGRVFRIVGRRDCDFIAWEMEIDRGEDSGSGGDKVIGAALK